MIRVGIVGCTGYTGGELLRLLLSHPQVDLATVTSRAEAGTRVDMLFPHLRGHCDLSFRSPDEGGLNECDAVFFATPHGVAQQHAAQLLEAGVRVIDLSADFRIRDAAIWEKWYAHKHAAPQLLQSAVYGLPEVNRRQIAAARLVAVPGCYPTAVQLGFLPLIEAGIVDTSFLVASAASGVSGAGKQASVDYLLAENYDSIRAYGAAGHRHLPEIEQGLQQHTSTPIRLTFIPHLAPIIRGIHATLVARLTDPSRDLHGLFLGRYASEPAVEVMEAGSHPQTRSVRGTNLCRISVLRPVDRDVVVVLSVIDNLVKGAAGQAIQNMNIMFGFAEQLGLSTVPALP
jgi:N-acetyl-gamma-glutamyl-phosphate reductase